MIKKALWCLEIKILEYIKNNGDNAFVNFHRYDNFICKTKAKKIMNVIEDNLRNINLSKVNKRKQ